MPRPCRNHLPGVPLHVIQRGNNRKPCFFTERDYAIYLDKLSEYSDKFEVDVHSFVLMTNHVHLLVTPESTSSVSQLMQSLGRYYVRYINRSYKRTGTLWEGRFKDSIIDSAQYLLMVSKYIELNPVRAGMVKHPAEYRWSSYRRNALGKNSDMITSHQIYQSLGATSAERQIRYSALFDGSIPDCTLEEIRAATNKSWVLGDGRFKREIEEQLGYALPPFPRGGDRKSTEYLSN